MSNSYGLEMKGAFVLEKVASLPTWASDDEGRLVYNETDKELYMGTNTQWEMKESDGYGATDDSFSDNDPLVAGTCYFIDTTIDSLTGILPSSPTIGQVVTIVDDGGIFKSHPFHINGNGKDVGDGSTLTLDVNYGICKLIFNGTKWITDMGGNPSSIGGGNASTGGVGTVIHVTADYTADDNDFIFVEAETGPVVVTLPSTGLANGSAVSVYDQRGAFSEEPCVVSGNGNDIMGQTTLKLKTKYARVDFIWDTGDAEWKTSFATGLVNDSINVIDKSANYSADVGDFILADTTAAEFSVTLPTSGVLNNKAMVTVLDQTGQWGSNALTIIPSDGTIDGDSYLICDIAGLKVDLVWDVENSQWKVDFGGSVLASTSSGNDNMTWQVKTTTFSAVENRKYICDTSGGAFTCTLPPNPTNGQVVQFAEGWDFATNNLTVARNGKSIEGLAEDMVVSTENQSFELIYYNNNWVIA